MASESIRALDEGTYHLPLAAYRAVSKVDWHVFTSQWEALLDLELKNYQFPDPSPDDDAGSDGDGAPPTSHSRRGSRIRLNMLSKALEPFLPGPGFQRGNIDTGPSAASGRVDRGHVEAGPSTRPSAPRAHSSPDVRSPASPADEPPACAVDAEQGWYADHRAQSAYAAQAKANHEAWLLAQRLKNAELTDQPILLGDLGGPDRVERIDHAERAAQAEEAGLADAGEGWSAAQTAALRQRIGAMNALNLKHPPILSWDQHCYKALCVLLRHHALETVWPTERSRRALVHNAWHFCPPHPDVAAGLRQLAAAPLACAVGVYSNAARPLIEQNAAAWRLPWARTAPLARAARAYLPHCGAWTGLARQCDEAPATAGSPAPATTTTTTKGSRRARLARTVVVGSRLEDLWRAKMQGFRVAYVARAGAETARRTRVRRAHDQESWCDYWVLRDDTLDAKGRPNGGFVELARQVQEELTQATLAELRRGNEEVERERELVEGEAVQGPARKRNRSLSRALRGGEQEDAT